MAGLGPLVPRTRNVVTRALNAAAELWFENDRLRRRVAELEELTDARAERIGRLEDLVRDVAELGHAGQGYADHARRLLEEPTP